MADSSHETKIVFTSDVLNAKAGINSLKAALSSVGKTIQTITSVLAKLNWAIGGIQMLAEGFRKLHESINAAAKRAEELFRSIVFDDASRAIGRMTSAQEKYNSALKESLDMLSRRSALDDQSMAGETEVENERRKLDRARQMATAMTPERQAELRQQWRVQDERIARDRRETQLGESAGRENQKARAYEQAASEAEKSIKRIDDALNQLLADVGGSDMTADEQKQLDALKAKKEAAEAELELYRKEARTADDRAKLYEKLRGELESVGSVAEAENEGENIRKEHDAAAKAREAEAERQREETDRRIEERKDREAKDREDRMRQEEEKASSLGAYADRLAATEGPTQNRLTAMGLGSGVASRSPVASDVRKIVDLLKQQLEEERKDKSGGAYVATFGA